MTLDRNQTVWQRLNAALEAVGFNDRTERDNLTTLLHPYVVAERNEVKCRN